MLIRLARHRDDAIAGAGEHVDGEAADAAGRAGDDDRAAVGRGAVAGERLDRERAVKPAVPIAIASNVDSASGIRTTQADGTRA